MKSPRKVSIVMPVFNEELYLKDCIDSIINQNFQHWELIAVDDFSSDKSYDILTHFASVDPRITCLRNSTKGIIPALRLAWQKSTGEFITRMDADDIMPINKLMKMSDALSSLTIGTIVTGKVEYFSADILENGFVKYQQWLNDMCDHDDHWNQIYKESVIPSACWMSRRSDLIKINAFSESRYPEDYDLVFKFYQANYKVHAIPEILHLWRDHPERASRNDPNYADQTFFHLKLHYFLNTDYSEQCQLILWGCGKKGKNLAKLLIDQNVSFKWVSNNPRKIGHSIYGIPIQDLDSIKETTERQIIISISDRNFEKEKLDIFQSLHLKSNEIFEFL